MPPNPLKLNRLQLKTLTLLQELARLPVFSEPQDDGGVVIHMLPDPHGNHFHIGPRVVMSNDATGLRNAAVHTALMRKQLMDMYPDGRIVLTPTALAYDTGMRDKILHGSDH